ncbi:hypothetical protein EOC93_07170 [Mesorhizobium sp. M6A.T.Ce.TU.002.03.1.1]|uniref:hypothetical protein n=1 Tax=unclassified Mesorhizobium TaxID=325217 RepID=UPI000F74F833|nr:MULTISPECIES: hypothetical protein [unclassified Mesorhizobium]AZO66395.1 hypothetical protein EJ075_16690 [Mesorhizobium sp. M6A.T.Cr.TU.016.01.1.1]RUU45331.1 hypothetical protein EOC93_07170 [Mesorhizobium sp. M6A.T.Ce.TU.002.03.1.1]RWP69650.1 MAG: hypothetical protein EOR09_29260 [Mesorhizobium sp.]
MYAGIFQLVSQTAATAHRGFQREGLENPDPAPIVKRKRVVNDAELAAIWTGCEPEPGDIGYSFGSIVKLLILTGQRRTEVAAMRWSSTLKPEHGTIG